jgi:hypothetical protein
MVRNSEKESKKDNRKEIFSYVGKPSHEMINLILEMSESKLKLIENRSSVVKRIVNVLIEILQNILNHGVDFNIVDSQSFRFSLYKIKEDYIIQTENLLKTSKVKDLVRKLNSYLSLSDKDLADTYRKTLDNGDFTIKGGAGLGLINIVRKSGGNLDYKFSKVDQENSLFQLCLQIKIE